MHLSQFHYLPLTPAFLDSVAVCRPVSDPGRDRRIAARLSELGRELGFCAMLLHRLLIGACFNARKIKLPPDGRVR